MTKSQEKKPEQGMDTKFILTITLKLLLISAITALLLAGVNALTAPTIAANNELEKKNAIAAIFPTADDIQKADVTADGVFVTDGGFELVWAIAAVALALVAVGPGRFSVDAALGSRRGSALAAR